jgi:ATP-binding cassette subfamily B protein
MFATAWRIDRRKTVLSVVLILAGAGAAPFLAAALRWMTNAAFGGAAQDAALAGAVVAMLAVVALSFGHFAHIAYFELSELAELDFDQRLVALSNGGPGIEHHERSEQADALTVLRQESRRFRMGLEALLQGLGLLLAMVVTGVLLATLHPLLLLLPLAAIPPLYAGRVAERVLDRAKTAVAEPTRVAQNLFQLSTSARAAGELRTFRLRRELLDRHGRLWQAATRGLWRAHLTGTWARSAGQLVFALAYVCAVLLVVRDAIDGRRGVGDVVMVVVLAVQVNQQVIMAVTLLENVQRMASAYRRLDEVGRNVRPALAGPVNQSPPERLRRGITFEDVSFCYPGTDKPVIRDVNLTLPAGAMVAVVGENGAGKTTLVKLLCGFYRPTGGSIRLDTVDLHRIPVEAWRRRIAVGFQDFVRYELAAQQVVGVGDLPNIGSRPAVRAALDRAQAAELVDELPDGLDTHLGKSYAAGAELSGGQWQRLALGRAMMREAPLLLILDEPASALDPEAEHALFERYSEQAQRVGEATGAVTVFVSHRFSTVRMADLIVVVRDGRVAEAGNHAELMAAGGFYADLFSLQEKAYR